MVELFGLPGAGKTTLCSKLSLELDHIRSFGGEQFSKHWAGGKLGRSLAVSIGTFTNLRLMLALIPLMLRLHLWRSGEAMLRVLRLLVRRAKLLHMLKRNSLLLDQAMLQDVWSILVASGSDFPDPDILAPVLGELYRGIAVEVLYLHLDPTTAAQRILGRRHGRSRFDGLPEVVVVQRLVRYAHLTASIAEAAQRVGLHIHSTNADAVPAMVIDAALQTLRASAPFTET